MAIPSLAARFGLATAVLLLASIPARADERLGVEDVRRAVMGHEAFIQRCVEDLFRVALDQLGEGEAAISVMMEDEEMLEMGRVSCDAYYKDINVCVEGGAASAINKLESHAQELDEQLADPSTRLKEYRNTESTRKSIEFELIALRALREGQADYCDPTEARE